MWNLTSTLVPIEGFYQRHAGLLWIVGTIIGICSAYYFYKKSKKSVESQDPQPTPIPPAPDRDPSEI
jgi:hypothetical protein